MRNYLIGIATTGLLMASACAEPRSPLEPGGGTPMADTGTPMPVPTPDPTPGPGSPSVAHYRVTFDSTWSAATHPADFPASAHYSGLIGGTHSSAVTFWAEGALASEGLQRMAERGSKQPLDDEVNRAIGAGTAEHVLSGPSLGTSPAAASMEFEISEAFPLVTLVTMVAPSPDWFAGVSGVSLRMDGQWIEEVRVDAFAFDAGTDSGTTYLSPDRETLPHQPVARLDGYPFADGGIARSIGTFTFRRLP